jgi:hypothetical protein
MIAYGLTTTARATSRPAAVSRPRRIASTARTTITASRVFTCPSTTSCPKNFSIATSVIATSSQAGFLASGSNARLRATSAMRSRMEIVNQTALAACSGNRPTGIAIIANAGRYLS